MKKYKTVAGPVGLCISQNESYEAAVRQYASIINREAVDGWELDCIQEIPVTKNNGCLGFLMNNASTTIKFNMLVFVREEDDVQPIKNLPETATPKVAAKPKTAVPPVADGAANQNAAAVSALISHNEKTCPKCGCVQRITRTVCWSCGQKFDN